MASHASSSYGPPRSPSQLPIMLNPALAALSQQQAMDQETVNLRGHLKTTLERFERMEAELNASQLRVAQDAETMTDLKIRVAELEDLVQRQKTTISNQSKTISDPRLLRKQQSAVAPVFPMTPHRQGTGQITSPFDTPFSTRSQFSGVYDHPPPRYDVNGTMASAAPASNSPVPMSHPFTYEQQLGLPPSRDPIVRPQSPFPALHFDHNKCMSELAIKFNEFWSKSEAFGLTHANVPNVYRDSQLDKKVKNYVMAVSDSGSASYLLNSATTRFHLVAKAINSYLIHNVLKITAIKGFDETADAEIGAIKKQLFPDTPSTIRHLMVVAMMNHVKSLKCQPGFSEFCLRRAHEHASKLWHLVGPLTPDSNVQAWSDLCALVIDAQALAIEIYSVPFEYKTYFSESNEPFDPARMINRDTFITGDPQVLKKDDNRVRLGITPEIRIRNNSAHANHIKLVYMANVLLRPGPKHSEVEAASEVPEVPVQVPVPVSVPVNQ